MLPSQQLIVALLELIHADLSIGRPEEHTRCQNPCMTLRSLLYMHLDSLSVSLSTNSPSRSTNVPEGGRCLSPGLRFVVMRKKLIFATYALCKSVSFSESVSF